MMKRTLATVGITAALALAGWTGALSAQDAPPPPPPGGGFGGPGGGPGGPGFGADFRQRMETMMKERLGVSDEEWKVFQPRLQKVQTLQTQSRGGGMGMGMGMGGRGGPGGPGAGGPGGPGGNRPGGDMAQTPVGKAAQELRTVLENQNASADEIKAKLAALRAARAQAKAELTKAQDELREVTNARQEAVLVSMNVLE